MKKHLGIRKALLGLSLLWASGSVLAADSATPSISGVQCQAIDSAEVAKPEFAVENFNRNSQAFLMCHLAEGETGADVLITGSIDLKKGTGSTAKISLDDFTTWNQDPSSKDLFVKSSLGTHTVKSFLLNTLPMDVQAIDSILGYAQSRPKVEQVCTTTTESKPVCSMQRVEECKIVYGRKECKMVDKEVCTTGQKPIESCHNETVISYFRRVKTIDGYVTFRPDSFCPYGMVEKQSKVVYGRVFNEKRCCESKVVDGAVKNVCTEWVAF